MAPVARGRGRTERRVSPATSGLRSREVPVRTPAAIPGATDSPCSFGPRCRGKTAPPAAGKSSSRWRVSRSPSAREVRNGEGDRARIVRHPAPSCRGRTWCSTDGCARAVWGRRRSGESEVREFRLVEQVSARRVGGLLGPLRPRRAPRPAPGPSRPAGGRNTRTEPVVPRADSVLLRPPAARSSPRSAAFAPFAPLPTAGDRGPSRFPVAEHPPAEAVGTEPARGTP